MENYSILEQIFEGSSGKIYKVQRIQDKKILACKELNYGEMDDKQKKQLISEVNILRELKSQNIVRCHDRIIDKINQKILLVLDYCENGDFQRLIESQKLNKQKFKEEQIWSFVIQLCNAIQEMHRRKSGIILHRDIKPSNVLIDQNFNLKLNDFGLSKVVKDETFQQTGFTNIQYLSPEQMNENIFTEKTDIWAFSCLIYELMFFKSPFGGQNQMQMALNINKQAVVFEEGYSKELQRLVSWGLEKDHRKRPSIDDLMSLPEISFHLRQKRLNDNQIFLQKRQKELEAKKISLDSKQKQMDTLRQQLLQKDEDLKMQHQKLQTIYEDSLQEQGKMRENSQKNIAQDSSFSKRPIRHNSLEHDQFEQENKINVFTKQNFFMQIKKQPQFTSQMQSKNKYLQKKNIY